MAQLPKELQAVSESLSHLPGIGPKLSARLALYLGVRGKKRARAMVQTITTMLDALQLCSQCNNVTTQTLCNVCSDVTRDQSTILLVEDSLDLYNIEETGEYAGLYHVLGGVISPVNGVGPGDIAIESLIVRVKDEAVVSELVFGLNPNMEGDATSLYIKNEVEEHRNNIQCTKLAKGIPVGSDIEFMSSQTIIDSVQSRRAF